VLANRLGEIEERHVEAQVGLVGTVAPHGLGVGEPEERELQRDPQGIPPERGHETLDHVLDVGLGHERHLEIDLRELRLPVEAQILVPEAAHDLEIAVEAAHHEELLEDLR